jgi:hypothetical protein
METKKCLKCREVKPASGFGNVAGTKSGLTSWCKDCSNAYVKRRQQWDKLQWELSPVRVVAETKNCSKCGKVKPVSGFYATSGTKNGLRSWCKDCDIAHIKKRYHEKKLMRKQNPDWVVAETKNTQNASEVKPASGFAKNVSKKSGLTAGRPSENKKAQTSLKDVSGDKGPMVQVNFKLDDAKHLNLKIYAARERRSIADIIRELIDRNIPEQN